MGWESRERGGRYYTRSKRVNGRIVREYIGTGLLAEATAYFDAKDRIEREEKAQKLKEERERLEEMDRAVREFSEEVDTLTRAVLIASGYHQHKQGEWRKRRA